MELDAASLKTKPFVKIQKYMLRMMVLITSMLQCTHVSLLLDIMLQLTTDGQSSTNKYFQRTLQCIMCEITETKYQ